MANPNVQHILDLAKSLSAADRASVARDLLATLDYPGQAVSSEAADSKWRSEARRRADELLKGEPKGVAAEDVHERIAQSLDKRR